MGFLTPSGAQRKVMTSAHPQLPRLPVEETHRPEVAAVGLYRRNMVVVLVGVEVIVVRLMTVKNRPPTAHLLNRMPMHKVGNFKLCKSSVA